LKELYFQHPQHQERYNELLRCDYTHLDDAERKALFYLISGNDDLYVKRNKIYDFRNHQIRLCLTQENVTFSSGSKALIRLGFNLYNGYKDEATTPADLFNHLDHDNRSLAFTALATRYLTG
jgi:hypothetical protein